jgi:hypothetical protein
MSISLISWLEVYVIVHLHCKYPRLLHQTNALVPTWERCTSYQGNPVTSAIQLSVTLETWLIPLIASRKPLLGVPFYESSEWVHKKRDFCSLHSSSTTTRPEKNLQFAPHIRKYTLFHKMISHFMLIHFGVLISALTHVTRWFIWNAILRRCTNCTVNVPSNNKLKDEYGQRIWWDMWESPFISCVLFLYSPEVTHEKKHVTLNGIWTECFPNISQTLYHSTNSFHVS